MGQTGAYEIDTDISPLFVDLRPPIMIVALTLQYLERLTHIVTLVKIPSIYWVF